MGRSGYGILWRVQEILQRWRNRILLYNERRKQHLQNAQYAHSKTFCIEIWRIMGTSLFINYLNLLQHWKIETIVAYTWNPTTSRTPTLCQYLTVNRSENTKSPNLELEIEFAFSSMIYFSGKVTNHNIHKNFLKLLPLLQKTSNIYNQRGTRRSYTWEILREGTN